MKITAKFFRLTVPALLVLASLPSSAAAQTRDAVTVPTNSAQAWLDLQVSGSAASPDERPMPGEIADKVYQRYVESFTQPIPESLKRDNFVSSGSDGG